MIDEEILRQKREALTSQLASLSSQHTLEQENYRKKLKEEAQKQLELYKKELEEELKEKLTEAKHQCEKEISEQKKAIVEEVKKEILELFKKNAKDDIKELTSKVEIEEAQVSRGIKLDNAKQSLKATFGIIYRPKGKKYYITAVADELLEEHPEYIYSEI